MKEYLQQRIYYNDIHGKEQTIGMFWIDEAGEVDIDNLPSNSEIAEMLKHMRLRTMEVEFTGIMFKECDCE